MNNTATIIEPSTAIIQETLHSLMSLWQRPGSNLDWSCLFVLPSWIKAWWEAFGDGSELKIPAVLRDGSVIGVAPLLIENDLARFVGSTDVCDYQDFVITPGEAFPFFETLMDYLREQGVTRLDLGTLRPDSTVLTHLPELAPRLGCKLVVEEEDISHEIDLAANWDGYLQQLKGKQRHEVRRKIRRLEEAGTPEFKLLRDPEAIRRALPTFMDLFTASRPDKADFMTDRMARFFRGLVENMVEADLLRLGFLELDGTTAAAVLGFEYDETMYLYNNGYDPNFSSVNVGLLCKVFSIRESIENGLKRYDFLKGSEVYKERLGGRPVTLYRCRIQLTPGNGRHS